MRISIIGPSASGKTTLAKKLHRKYGVKHYDLDCVFFKVVPDKRRILLSPREYSKKLSNILKRESWIIEGINPVAKVFESANLIVFLKPSLYTSLYRQWRRFFTDKRQRKEHGFINNLKLSRFILRQYLTDKYLKKAQGSPKSFRMTKVGKMIKRYTDKTVVLGSNEDIEEFLLEFEGKRK